jgi:CMP-N-acetylneuraminic acid synthetase
MKIAVQIPIKSRSSTRVPNKNFRDLAGKPFSCWLLDELVKNCPEDWDLYIDSESVNAYDQFDDRYSGRIKFHKRNEWFASDAANGNHLLSQFSNAHPEYDVFVQVFVTAITLTAAIIRESIEAFTSSADKYDSMFLVTEKTGWFWFQGKPMNYDPSRPDGLPRSQDALVFEETTGLYAITRDAVMRTGCRIGKNPLMYKIPHKYAYDVDTMEDFAEAQRLLSQP